MSIALVALLTVASISLLSNLLIEKHFQAYIKRQQTQKTQGIIANLSQQYLKSAGSWNEDYLHAIGMTVLSEGYILKIRDLGGNVLWDARAHDMTHCRQMMREIAHRMKTNYPQLHGGFAAKTFPLTHGGHTVGSVAISYYEPFFYSNNDFQFLAALNDVLLKIALVSLACSVLVGALLAKRLSRPILKTVAAAKQIADGHYQILIDEKTDTSELLLLMQSINHLAASLTKQDKLRKQLTKDVSHELRTPIAILQTHIEAMLDGVWQPSAKHLEQCRAEVVRLGKLVGDLEKLERADYSNLKLNKTEFELTALIRQAVSSFEVEIENKRLAVLQSGAAVKLFADRDRIWQVLTNLLSNAVKYTASGGRIAIEVGETPQAAFFRITDNGIGISEEELPYVFERFYRADKSRDRKTGGSGIGLAIVKAIVDAHGGRINVRSNLKCGSTFEVILPK
jgi:signal transduction histidine kinase